MSISFNRNEQFEVYMLFKTNANYSLPSSEDSLKKLVGEDILALTRDIIQKVNDSYYIDLNHETFLTPFALHLKNLQNPSVVPDFPDSHKNFDSFFQSDTASHFLL